jgi:hypothetical protein
MLARIQETVKPYERGRKPIVDVDDDPYRAVLYTVELPVALRQLGKDKATRTRISLAEYLRGCVVEFIQAEEPSTTSTKDWQIVEERLRLGKAEPLREFIEKHVTAKSRKRKKANGKS